MAEREREKKTELSTFCKLIIKKKNRIWTAIADLVKFQFLATKILYKAAIYVCRSIILVLLMTMLKHCRGPMTALWKVVGRKHLYGIGLSRQSTDKVLLQTLNNPYKIIWKCMTDL